MAQNKSKISSLIIVMLMVALIAAALLSVINQVTKEPIQKAQNKMVAESIQEDILDLF